MTGTEDWPAKLARMNPAKLKFSSTDMEPSAKELETPETDKSARMVTLVDYHAQRLDVVDSDFARLLERRLNAALAENAALRADKERLDWLEENPVNEIGFSEDLRWLKFNGENFTNYRAAIDAARKTTQP